MTFLYGMMTMITTKSLVKAQAEYDKIHPILAYVADHSFAPDTHVVQAEWNKMLLNAIDKMKPKSATVLMLYYGLGGFDSHTFDEIANIFGISKQRVAQLHGKALARLRELLADDII